MYHISNEKSIEKALSLCCDIVTAAIVIPRVHYVIILRKCYLGTGKIDDVSKASAEKGSPAAPPKIAR